MRVIRVGTLTDQMLFDKERLVVQAGKPVEIVFENTDIMPHNFVIVQPGVAGGGRHAGRGAGHAARRRSSGNYVPQSNKVLLASRLLQPREPQRLRFTAPTKPGVYPYVCTYPGHWRRMYGALYVVADLEAYLADPEGYLAKNPLPVKDELLKFNRPRKEWKFEELAGEVEKMQRRPVVRRRPSRCSRSASVRRRATSSSGVGQEFGPDLTKLDPKIDKPADMLQHILEPSLKIDEKYQTWIVRAEQRARRSPGMILEEKNGVVQGDREPAGQGAKPIDDQGGGHRHSRRSRPTSLMPKGLLDKLTKEEILDLIAYIAAKGNDKHALFQGNTRIITDCR